MAALGFFWPAAVAGTEGGGDAGFVVLLGDGGAAGFVSLPEAVAGAPACGTGAVLLAMETEGFLAFAGFDGVR